jgi:PIN domain nuclease of toxin-antitoxin system
METDAQAAIEDPRSQVLVSAASAWEIAVKQSVGKLRIPDDLDDQLRLARFLPLPVTIAHGLAVASMPLHHRDPFDRLLVAQARLENLTIVTRDPRIAAYDVPTLAA